MTNFSKNVFIIKLRNKVMNSISRQIFWQKTMLKIKSYQTLPKINW